MRELIIIALLIISRSFLTAQHSSYPWFYYEIGDTLTALDYGGLVSDSGRKPLAFRRRLQFHKLV